MADRFAYEIGFGNNLVESLYLLQGMRMSDKSKLVNKLKASHPHIAKRIGTIERLIDSEDEGNTDDTYESDTLVNDESDTLYQEHYDGYMGEDIDQYIDDDTESIDNNEWTNIHHS